MREKKKDCVEKELLAQSKPFVTVPAVHGTHAHVVGQPQTAHSRGLLYLFRHIRAANTCTSASQVILTRHGVPPHAQSIAVVRKHDMGVVDQTIPRSYSSMLGVPHEVTQGLECPQHRQSSEMVHYVPAVLTDGLARPTLVAGCGGSIAGVSFATAYIHKIE